MSVDDTVLAPPDAYSGEDIKILEGLEAVRVRPAMYIGSTGRIRAASPLPRGD